jgi:hypothetical protein
MRAKVTGVEPSTRLLLFAELQEMLSIGSMQCVKRPNSLRRSIPDVFSIHGFSLSHPELLIIMPSFFCFHIF